MPKHSLVLNNEIQTLNESTEVKQSMGFIIKYEGAQYIITTHHFLPVLKTSLNIQSEKIELKKIKDIYWNELNIFDLPDSKFLHNTPIIKNIKTRFLEPKTTIKLEINGMFMKFPTVDYHAFCPNILSNLRNIYLRFYIGKSNDTVLLSKFRGLSGSPVFSNENHLIGVFCKYQIKDEQVYGWVLPSIYITKTISKYDNQNMYYIKHECYDRLKIGQYEVQKDKDELFIYHLPVNYKLPLDIFFYLEGDENKFLQIKDNLTNEITSVNFIKNENFDIKLYLEKKDNNFKLNSGLFSLLMMKGYQIQIGKIVDTFFKGEKKLNDIWLSFNDSFQIDLEKLQTLFI